MSPGRAVTVGPPAGTDSDVAGAGGAGTAKALGSPTTSGALNVGATAIGGTGGDATTGGQDRGRRRSSRGERDGDRLLSPALAQSQSPAFATGESWGSSSSIPLCKALAGWAASQPATATGSSAGQVVLSATWPPAARAAAGAEPGNTSGAEADASSSATSTGAKPRSAQRPPRPEEMEGANRPWPGTKRAGERRQHEPEWRRDRPRVG